jgi:hypothetical protein
MIDGEMRRKESRGNSTHAMDEHSIKIMKNLMRPWPSLVKLPPSNMTPGTDVLL